MSQKNILILDNEPDNIEIITLAMKANSAYHVDHCHNPITCFDMLHAKHYDLLITDCELSHPLSGLDVITWVREHEPEVKIILTSCRDDIAKQTLPIDGFYQKATSITLLTDMIERL